jgi:hypothetical protein
MSLLDKPICYDPLCTLHSPGAQRILDMHALIFEYDKESDQAEKNNIERTLIELLRNEDVTK